MSSVVFQSCYQYINEPTIRVASSIYPYYVAFISAAIAVCYLFLLFYAWIFLGDEVRLDFPQMGFHNTVILKPITTLKFVSKGK